MTFLRKRNDTQAPKSRNERGLTIRLKLTLWYGLLFLLAGVLLITINYLLVRDSLVPAPGKAREHVEELFGLEPGILEVEDRRGGTRVPRQIWIVVDGAPITISVPALLAEAQEQLKQEALKQLWTRSLLALGIMSLITFSSAWLLAGRMLRPLNAITATARRLSGSTLHERIDLRGPHDELKERADTFDEMLGRLDTAFTAQKDFVANASHELRTPLTIIRTEIDVALADPEISADELRGMGSAVDEAVTRSEQLIDSLLVLARTDESPVMADVDLAEMVRKVVSADSPEADDRGLRLELDLQPGSVLGEEALLERMVTNLVDNAIRHNVDDGWFSVRTWSDDSLTYLEVANGGPVVPAGEARLLFDRFYRLDRSRSRKTGGFGLGLSIVKSVVTAHQGTVELQAPEEGGLRVTVTLPATQPLDTTSQTQTVS